MDLNIGTVLSTGETVAEIRRGGFAEVAVLDDGFGGKKVVKRIRPEVLAGAGDSVAEALDRKSVV